MNIFNIEWLNSVCMCSSQDHNNNVQQLYIANMLFINLTPCIRASISNSQPEAYYLLHCGHYSHQLHHLLTMIPSQQRVGDLIVRQQQAADTHTKLLNERASGSGRHVTIMKSIYIYKYKCTCRWDIHRVAAAVVSSDFTFISPYIRQRLP